MAPGLNSLVGGSGSYIGMSGGMIMSGNSGIGVGSFSSAVPDAK